MVRRFRSEIAPYTARLTRTTLCTSACSSLFSCAQYRSPESSSIIIYRTSVSNYYCFLQCSPVFFFFKQFIRIVYRKHIMLHAESRNTRKRLERLNEKSRTETLYSEYVLQSAADHCTVYTCRLYARVAKTCIEQFTRKLTNSQLLCTTARTGAVVSVRTFMPSARRRTRFHNNMLHNKSSTGEKQLRVL